MGYLCRIYWIYLLDILGRRYRIYLLHFFFFLNEAWCFFLVNYRRRHFVSPPTPSFSRGFCLPVCLYHRLSLLLSQWKREIARCIIVWPTLNFFLFFFFSLFFSFLWIIDISSPNTTPLSRFLWVSLSACLPPPLCQWLVGLFVRCCFCCWNCFYMNLCSIKTFNFYQFFYFKMRYLWPLSGEVYFWFSVLFYIQTVYFWTSLPSACECGHLAALVDGFFFFFLINKTKGDVLFRFERLEDVFYRILDNCSCPLFELRPESEVLWYLHCTWLTVRALVVLEIGLWVFIWARQT